MRLPLEIQSKVASGVLSAGHARALLAAPNAESMIELANRTIREGISVRGLEELVSDTKDKPKKGKIIPGGKTDMLKEMAQELSDELDTVVKINLGRKKGQMIIEFGNIADLRRIADQIRGN